MKNTQKRLAAKIRGCSSKRIKLDSEKLEDIKEAITKADVRSLIKKGVIKVVQKKGVSRGRAKKAQAQRVKGRRRGHGSRKGRTNARLNSKDDWMNRIRLLRSILKKLKENKKITDGVYRDLYLKAKGGFFRSKRHMKLYIGERGLIKK